MSQFRHAAPGRESFLIVRSLALRLPAGYRIDHHDHDWGQVIFAPRGTMAVESSDRFWIVPPHRALWMPAGARHRITTIGETWMRTVYLRHDLAARVAEGIRVLDVAPLLRELLLEVVRRGALDETIEEEVSLARVLGAQLAAARAFGVSLPLPSDPRARRVADRIVRAPGSEEVLHILARDAGASSRTIERLFVGETGLSFGRWRQQARLQHAVCRLAEGVAVTRVALECGYESPSAFVTMFRRALGAPPGEYVRQRHHPESHAT
jgi:AraC-like DNA-binding protein